MLHKPSLKWYRIGKENLGYENCYRNSKRSTYLAKARINSLQLEEHLGRGKPNYDTTCKLCHMEEENLEHFLTKSPMLESKRDPEIMGQWKNMDTEIQTVNILFKERNYEKTAKMIQNMWELS